MAVTDARTDALHARLQAILQPVGQLHLLQFWSRLDDSQRRHLGEQILACDWPRLQALFGAPDGATDSAGWAARCQLPPALTWEEFHRPDRYRAAVQLGGDALRAGRVAFVLTAGGQGTRLGFEHPKGMFPIGPVSGRTLFQIMIDHLRARARQFGSVIPLYVMTSPLTHEATVAFLQSNRWFGCDERDAQVFCQGVMPAIDRQTRRVLLAAPDELATSPDGHGGALAAMQRGGVLADMRRRGVEHVFYGQIDNPLLQVCDPALIGYHVLHQSEMTSQAIRKTDPLQRVGNFVQVDGRVQIIEYSDLPDDVARQRQPDGSLRLWAGSIAVHVFERRFLERAADRADGLPFHRAIKRVSYVDERGHEVIPAEPNAVKFERFIFDLLPWADRPLVCEVVAEEGFAALKNAPPAKTETAEWVRAAMSQRFRRWLAAAGGTIAQEALLEINPMFAVDEEELRQRLPPGTHFSESTYLH